MENKELIEAKGWCKVDLLKLVNNKQDLGKFFETAKELNIEFVEHEPTLEEAIKVLQKHFKPKGDSSKGLPSQILNSEKLSILKSIANSGGIDWNEVKEGDRIISLELKLFKQFN